MIITKSNQYRATRIRLILQLLLVLAIFLASTGIVVAQKNNVETDLGLRGTVCYDSGTGNIQVPKSDSGASACTAAGLKLINPGDPVPVRICVGNGEAQTIPGPEADPGCLQHGGTVVAPGQPLPEFFARDDAAGEAAKNRQDNNDSPAAITNSDRDAIRDCNEGADACLRKNPIMKWTLFAINFLSAGVGVIVTIMIVVGGIQYASAGGNPQAVQAAKSRIANAVLALVAYFFLFAFMQWLVPGGLF